MKSKRIIVVLNCKKMFFKSQLCKAVDFFIWWLKKLVCLKKCPFYGFRFRDARKGCIYKTDEIKRVCPSQQGLPFREWLIYAGFTVHCLMIICKYFSLGHKPNFQRNGLIPTNLFHCFNYLNRFSVWYS